MLAVLLVERGGGEVLRMRTSDWVERALYWNCWPPLPGLESCSAETSVRAGPAPPGGEEMGDVGPEEGMTLILCPGP